MSEKQEPEPEASTLSLRERMHRTEQQEPEASTLSLRERMHRTEKQEPELNLAPEASTRTEPNTKQEPAPEARARTEPLEALFAEDVDEALIELFDRDL